MVNKANWEIFEIQRFLEDLFDRYQILNLFFHLFQKRRKLFKFTLHWSIFWHKITFKGEYIFKMCHLPFMSPFLPRNFKWVSDLCCKNYCSTMNFSSNLSGFSNFELFFNFKCPLYILYTTFCGILRVQSLKLQYRNNLFVRKLEKNWTEHSLQKPYHNFTELRKIAENSQIKYMKRNKIYKLVDVVR